jgi:hypothetical protein
MSEVWHENQIVTKNKTMFLQIVKLIQIIIRFTDC